MILLIVQDESEETTSVKVIDSDIHSTQESLEAVRELPGSLVTEVRVMGNVNQDGTLKSDDAPGRTILVTRSDGISMLYVHLPNLNTAAVDDILTRAMSAEPRLGDLETMPASVQLAEEPDD